MAAALALGPDVALSRRVAFSRARGALSRMGVRSTLWTSRAAAKSPPVSWPALFQDRSWRRSLGAARPSSGMLRRYRRFFAVAAFLVLAAPLVAGLVYPDGAASILAEGRTPAPAPTSACRQRRLVQASEADRRLSAGPYRPSSGFAPRASGTLEAAVRQLQGPDGPRRPYVLSGQRDGSPERRAHYARPGGGSNDRFARAHERRASSPRHPFSGRAPAERLERLYRTTCRFGRKMQAARPNMICFWRTSPPKAFRLSICGPCSRKLALAARSFICTIRIGHSAARSWRLTQLSRRTRIPIGGSTRVQPCAPAVRKGGDMAKILGLSDKISEYTENLTLPYGRRIPLPDNDFIETFDKPGPKILIFGDSLTLDFFPPMLLQHVGSVIWIHHEYCGFDWRVIDELRPDEVWWMPGERVFLCQHSPIGFPEAEKGAGQEKAPVGFGRPADALEDRAAVRQ